MHRLRQLDGVVVAERAFDRDRELEVVARDVRVEIVEAAEERPVPGHLLDVLVGQVDVRDVVRPPLVVLGEVGPEGVVGAHVAVALVVRRRGGELGGDCAELELHSHGASRIQGHVADEVVAARREALTAEARGHGGQVVAGVEAADPLVAVERLGDGVRGAGGDRAGGRLAAGVDQREDRDCDVVLGDELALVDAQAAAGVNARPVARILAPVGSLLGERVARHGDRVQVRDVAGDRLAIAESAAALVGTRTLAGEAEDGRAVAVHEEGTALGVQGALARAAGALAGALQHPVDPVRAAAGGLVGIEEGLEHVAGRVERDRAVGHRVVETDIGGRSRIDGRWHLRVRSSYRRDGEQRRRQDQDEPGRHRPAGRPSALLSGWIRAPNRRPCHVCLPGTRGLGEQAALRGRGLRAYEC